MSHSNFSLSTINNFTIEYIKNISLKYIIKLILGSIKIRFAFFMLGLFLINCTFLNNKEIAHFSLLCYIVFLGYMFRKLPFNLKIIVTVLPRLIITFTFLALFWRYIMPIAFLFPLLDLEDAYTLNIFGGDNPESSKGTKGLGGEGSRGPKGPEGPSKPIISEQSDKDKGEDFLERLNRLLAKSNAQIEEHKDFLSGKLNSDKLIAEHLEFQKLLEARKTAGFNIFGFQTQLVGITPIGDITSRQQFIENYLRTLEENSNERSLVPVGSKLVTDLTQFNYKKDVNKAELYRLWILHSKSSLDTIERAVEAQNEVLPKKKAKLSPDLKKIANHVKILKKEYAEDKPIFLNKEREYHLRCKELGQDSVKDFLNNLKK